MLLILTVDSFEEALAVYRENRMSTDDCEKAFGKARMVSYVIETTKEEVKKSLEQKQRVTRFKGMVPETSTKDDEERTAPPVTDNHLAFYAIPAAGDAGEGGNFIYSEKHLLNVGHDPKPVGSGGKENSLRGSVLLGGKTFGKIYINLLTIMFINIPMLLFNSLLNIETEQHVVLLIPEDTCKARNVYVITTGSTSETSSQLSQVNQTSNAKGTARSAHRAVVKQKVTKKQTLAESDSDYEPGVSPTFPPKKKRRGAPCKASAQKNKKGQCDVVTAKVCGRIPNVTDAEGKRLPLKEKKAFLQEHVLQRIEPVKMPMRHDDVPRSQQKRGKWNLSIGINTAKLMNNNN
jgi:hypothetical protein